MKYLLQLTCALGLAAASAQAATVVNSQANLANPEFVIGFDEVALSNGTDVTDQYAAFGATFSGLKFDDGFAPRPNTNGALLFNFPVKDASVTFAAAVSDATFAFSSNQGQGMFTSLLNGVVVESFTASIAGTASPGNTVGNVFGFTGSLFDEIRFTTTGSTGASFDNLSFNSAPPVPLPASLPLALAAFGGLLALRRRSS